MSIRTKLSLALGLLLAFNSAYFVIGARSVAEMDQIARTLYDRVVMSSTYSEMVKNDFQRWASLRAGALLDPDPAARQRSKSNLDDAAVTFREDLAVVKERALSPENRAAVDEIAAEFERLSVDADRGAAMSSDAVGTLARVRRWSRSTARQALLVKISDLTDRVVADGYEYRVKSEKRSAAIGRTSVICSIAVLILNLLCLGFILASILPRLRRLTAVCAEIAAGHFDRRVNVTSSDELGRLGVAFNVMLEALRRSEEKVEAQLITTNALMDGLGQGFLMIAPDRTCLPVFSRACLDLLEGSPAGRRASDVLRVPAGEHDEFGDWLDVVFADVGTFDDLATLGPTHFPHTGGRTVTLEYKPLRTADGTLRAVVVVATDRTAEVRARGDAEREHEVARMVTKLMRHRGDFTRFFADAPALIAEVRSPDPAIRKRALHTLKGAAATLSLGPLRDLAHRIEDEWAEASVIVSPVTAVARLNDELARTRAWLATDFGFESDGASEGRRIPLEAMLAFDDQLAQTPGATDLRAAFAREFLDEDAVEIFAPLEHLGHDVAERLGKRVNVKIEAEDVRLRREAYADLVNVLGHAIRNAVDHGVELPWEREALGKPAAATVRIEVVRTADRTLQIRIADDGRGVDVARLRERLTARGLDVTSIDDAVVLQHVFDAGVSTAAVVTDLSGRGVGMDAVRAVVTTLGGQVRIESEPKRGTAMVIELPVVDGVVGRGAA